MKSVEEIKNMTIIELKEYANSMSNEEFEKFVINFLINSDLVWDQAIRETSGKSKWLHIGYRNGAGKQRKQVFDLHLK